jgi:hypothetical protein
MPRFDPSDYVQVNERLELFRKEHPDWGLMSYLLHQDDSRVIVRAVVTNDLGREVASGLAEEVRDSSPVNKTSAVENCETSAWGRALANLGYEVKRSIASREEMEKVQRQEEPKAERSQESVTAPPDPIKARQAKAITAIKNLSKDQRAALRQLMAEANMSQKPEEWTTPETLDQLSGLVREARKAGAEVVEASA